MLRTLILSMLLALEFGVVNNLTPSLNSDQPDSAFDGGDPDPSIAPVPTCGGCR